MTPSSSKEWSLHRTQGDSPRRAALAAGTHTRQRLDEILVPTPLGEPSAGPEIRSGVEWLPAVESGRAIGFTLPTLAADYLPADVTTVPVVDVEPGSVLLAWPSDSVDPLVDAFVSLVRKTIADFAGAEGETAGSR